MSFYDMNNPKDQFPGSLICVMQFFFSAGMKFLFWENKNKSFLHVPPLLSEQKTPPFSSEPHILWEYMKNPKTDF